VGGRGTNIAGCGGCYEEKRCGTLIKKCKVGALNENRLCLRVIATTRNGAWKTHKKCKVGAQTENRQRLRVIEVDKYAFFVIMFI
jgi:hypothetical protein